VQVSDRKFLSKLVPMGCGGSKDGAGGAGGGGAPNPLMMDLVEQSDCLTKCAVEGVLNGHLNCSFQNMALVKAGHGPVAAVRPIVKPGNPRPMEFAFNDKGGSMIALLSRGDEYYTGRNGDEPAILYCVKPWIEGQPVGVQHDSTPLYAWAQLLPIDSANARDGEQKVGIFVAKGDEDGFADAPIVILQGGLTKAKALNVKHEKVAGLDKQGKQFAIAGGVDPITMTAAYIELYTYPYRYPK